MSYSFSMKTVSDVGNPNVKYNYAVITTEIENTKPEIIKKRLIDVPHIGINGGFFEEPPGGYTVPPKVMTLFVLKKLKKPIPKKARSLKNLFVQIKPPLK